METLEAIQKRRATRDFKHEKVPRPVVLKLIDAAVHAPSGMNTQPWAFAVIQDEARLKKLSDQAKTHIQINFDKARLSKDGHLKEILEHVGRPDFNIFYNASTLIVIYARNSGYDPAPECFLAGENLMLAATAMGLGTCPIGFAKEVLNLPEVRRDLDVPPEYTAVLPLIVGYPAGSIASVPRAEPRIFAWKEVS